MDFRPNMEISQNMEDVPEIKLDLPNIKKEIYRVLKVNISNIFYTFFQTGLDFFFEYYSLLFKIPPPPFFKEYDRTECYFSRFEDFWG